MRDKSEYVPTKHLPSGIVWMLIQPILNNIMWLLTGLNR